ncbi:PREDICTED: uncharacterized protein LOC108525657 [Rhinopithecus bieti]|uniref:uncharacterized protein LOC108525657 n=1 Tax=Rhinopithecus bieti TaxID=61621 RepID=UPI00083C5FA4|nr:PREDICTED: uncharacterized protein LOC108525657 [Rhinopithecus bieti]
MKEAMASGCLLSGESLVEGELTACFAVFSAAVSCCGGSSRAWFSVATRTAPARCTTEAESPSSASHLSVGGTETTPVSSWAASRPQTTPSPSATSHVRMWFWSSTVER